MKGTNLHKTRLLMLELGLTKGCVVSTLPSRLLIIVANYYDSRPGRAIFCCVAATMTGALARRPLKCPHATSTRHCLCRLFLDRLPAWHSWNRARQALVASR